MTAEELRNRIVQQERNVVSLIAICCSKNYYENRQDRRI